MIRFPTRTLVLMVLALVAFGWFWWQMHRVRTPVTVDVLEGADAGLAR